MTTLDRSSIDAVKLQGAELPPAVVEIAPVHEARRLERRLARERAGLLHDAEHAAQARVGERKIARHDVHGERVLERAPREGAAGAQLRGTELGRFVGMREHVLGPPPQRFEEADQRRAVGAPPALVDHDRNELVVGHELRDRSEIAEALRLGFVAERIGLQAHVDLALLSRRARVGEPPTASTFTSFKPKPPALAMSAMKKVVPSCIETTPMVLPLRSASVLISGCAMMKCGGRLAMPATILSLPSL